MSTLQTWLDLCTEITGVERISERFVLSAKDALIKKHGHDEVSDFIEKFSSEDAEVLFEQIRYNEISRDLIEHLYFGSMTGADDLKAEDYFESLIWRVTLSHPRGLSGGYFGHWHYPPEDLDA